MYNTTTHYNETWEYFLLTVAATCQFSEFLLVLTDNCTQASLSDDAPHKLNINITSKLPPLDSVNDLWIRWLVVFSQIHFCLPCLDVWIQAWTNMKCLPYTQKYFHIGFIQWYQPHTEETCINNSQGGIQVTGFTVVPTLNWQLIISFTSCTNCWNVQRLNSWSRIWSAGFCYLKGSAVIQDIQSVGQRVRSAPPMNL